MKAGQIVWRNKMFGTSSSMNLSSKIDVCLDEPMSNTIFSRGSVVGILVGILVGDTYGVTQTHLLCLVLELH